MKTICLASLLVAGLCPFVSPAQTAEPEAPATVSEDVIAPDAAAQEMIGNYVGAFGENKINVCLEKVVGSSVLGYSVVAGNQRAFSGSFGLRDGIYQILTKEPGDDPEDGVFTFQFQPGSTELKGSWQPYSKFLQSKSFALGRKNFKYDPTAGNYPESSTRLLKVEDVENIHPEDLRIMRNEIYGRHGYSFRVKDMRAYFDQQDWYMPVSVDVTSSLTKIEKKNQDLIKRYEKYTAKYYDSFGR